ncbi:MAG TPA: hypothetical protein VMF69_14050 [Gemmataceae bacterium]|nr:hypothetical protein [Gemmataceae bacterium]
MPVEKEALRDWHRLFGLLLTDFFTDSPFTVEIESDLSAQQQLLDVVIVRQKSGRFVGRLPDGLDDLTKHNLITFKSHREALDDWAIRELVGHYVAYRKLISSSPSDLLPADLFRLYAVAARFPHNLSGQVPWQQRQAGVYDCRWGLDTVRVVVAGQLPREAHNAPLHLFSAAPQLVGFASGVYRQRSEDTSSLLKQLFTKFQQEGFTMSYTMADFRRDYTKEHFPELTLEEQADALQLLSPERQVALLRALPPERQAALLQSLPPEKRLEGLSVEQIQQYLDRLTTGHPGTPRKTRRKK